MAIPEQEIGEVKYYVLNYRYRQHKQVINYGDNLQSIAVRHLLEKFGVTDGEIGHIVRDDMGMKDHNRVPGIFIPATGGLSWNSYPDYRDVPINDHNLSILYFGVRIPEGSFDVLRHCGRFIESLKKYEPIGCRDTCTRDFLRSLGIQSYFSKCVTLAFDKRPDSTVGNNIYLVDDNDGEDLRGFIPSNIQETLIQLPAILDAPKPAPMTECDCFQVNREAAERLDLFRKDAKLVISSRIHVAIPCAALGIPVIFVDRTPDYSRTSIARHLLPTVSPKGLEKLDYENVKPADFSKHKEEMRLLFGYGLENASRRLGAKNVFLTNGDRSRAKRLLDRLCTEDEPKNAYTPRCFSNSRMIDALFGARKSDVLKLNRPLVLFGAGEFGGRLKTILNRAGLSPVCYADNAISANESAWSHSLRIISFGELCRNHRNSFIIIAVPGRHEEVVEQLGKHGFRESLIFDSARFCAEFIEYIPPLEHTL